MTARADQLDELYRLIDEHRARLHGGRVIAGASGRDGWPERGVYFFFEPGELRADGTTPRVVRVGTHGLPAGSRSTLWGRLRQHRGSVGGRSAGGGNHRGSVFRLHVGAALLADPEWPAEVRSAWGHGANAPRQVRAAEEALERAVSAYIGRMSVIWVEVDDPPGPVSDRGLIERGAIALLSNARGPAVDPPSDDWLGRRSPNEAIREAGLWNVQHIADPLEPRFLGVLAEQMAAS